YLGARRVHRLGLRRPGVHRRRAHDPDRERDAFPADRGGLRRPANPGDGPGREPGLALEGGGLHSAGLCRHGREHGSPGGRRARDPLLGLAVRRLGARAVLNPGVLSSRIAFVAALLFTALSVVLVYDHTREDSLSADEPIHILSGYFAVASRSAIVNIEHPPLIKILSGLSVTRLPLKPPPPKVPMGNVFVVSSPSFFFNNSVPPDAIIAAARAPQLLVLAGLLPLVFAAARSRYGPGAALLALALLAFDPNLLAHAGVVHTDLGASLAFLAVVLAWEGHRRRPHPLRFAASAVALGLPLAPKFSTLYPLPILALQALLAARRDPSPGRTAGAGLLRLAAAGAGALLVVLAVYAPVTSRMDPADQKTVIREKVGVLGGAPAMAERIASLA